MILLPTIFKADSNTSRHFMSSPEFTPIPRGKCTKIKAHTTCTKKPARAHGRAGLYFGFLGARGFILDQWTIKQFNLAMR